MKKVYICSPAVCEISMRQEAVQALSGLAVRMGHAPFIPQTHYEGLRDRKLEGERITVLACALAYMDACCEVWLYAKHGLSPEMKIELKFACALGKPVRLFSDLDGFGEWPDEESAPVLEASSSPAPGLISEARELAERLKISMLSLKGRPEEKQEEVSKPPTLLKIDSAWIFCPECEGQCFLRNHLQESLASWQSILGREIKLPGASDGCESDVFDRAGVDWRLGVESLERGDHKRAKAFLQKALAGIPYEALAWLDYGRCLMEDGDYQGAALAYLNALYIQDDDPAAWNGLGEVMLKADQAEAALTAYEKAFKLFIDFREEDERSGFLFMPGRIGRRGASTA